MEDGEFFEVCEDSAALKKFYEKVGLDSSDCGIGLRGGQIEFVCEINLVHVY